MAKAKSKVRTEPRPLAERLRIAREINEYRAANPRVPVPDVMKALGYGDIKESAYWTWRKRLELAEATGEPANGEKYAIEVEQHFPIAIIPERHPIPAPKRVKVRDAYDENKELAASLLEVAAKLLRR